MGGLAQIFQEVNGKPSLSRACTAAVVAAVLFVYLSHNIQSLRKGLGIIPIDWNAVALLTGAMGIHAYHRRGEKDPAGDDDSSDAAPEQDNPPAVATAAPTVAPAPATPAPVVMPAGS